MKIDDLLIGHQDHFIDNHGKTVFTDRIPGWILSTTKRINSVIACGWLENDDVVVVSSDGLYVVNKNNGEILYEDLDTEAREIFSSDNLDLKFFYQGKEVTVRSMGLRTGDGNRFSRDWMVTIEKIRYNICVPLFKSARYVNNDFYFLKLSLLEYIGFLYCGFSPSCQYFIIMGNEGIEVYRKSESTN